MGFSSDSGYTPATIDQIIDSIMAGVNAQFGTSYTSDTFIGTNFYKYFYALAQRVQRNEVKTSEIFLYLQQYFVVTNQKIQRPVVTNPGLIEVLGLSNYVASVKPANNTDRGKIFVCVDLDSGAAGYAAKKLAVNTILKDSTVAGAVTQGTEVSSIVLTNGQSFDFKFNLPNRITTTLRLTITTSTNNMVEIEDPDITKDKLLANIAAKYRLGRDFEPEKYFTTDDAPWASSVLLEWSSDGGSTYSSAIYTANYDDLFAVDLSRVHLVEV